MVCLWLLLSSLRQKLELEHCVVQVNEGALSTSVFSCVLFGALSADEERKQRLV